MKTEAVNSVANSAGYNLRNTRKAKKPAVIKTEQVAVEKIKETPVQAKSIGRCVVLAAVPVLGVIGYVAYTCLPQVSDTLSQYNPFAAQESSWLGDWI